MTRWFKNDGPDSPDESKRAGWFGQAVEEPSNLPERKASKVWFEDTSQDASTMEKDGETMTNSQQSSSLPKDGFEPNASNSKLESENATQVDHRSLPSSHDIDSPIIPRRLPPM